MTHPPSGLDTLLDLDGSIFEQEDGFWIKVEAKRVEHSASIPHGIKYCLTLHNRYGTRVMGYDNAHLRGDRPRDQGSQGVVMKMIVIGILPQEQIRARAMAIARGEYKPKPG